MPIVSDNPIPILSLDEIIRLSDLEKSVLLITGSTQRRLPAMVVRHMTIDTVQKFIKNKQLLY